MIVITGAAGKTGQALIRALANRGEPVRALVHREAQIESVRAIGAAEARWVDFSSPADLVSALSGARRVYHICPNMHPGEIEIGQKMLLAARTAGLELFAYHSVLHPQTEEMPHHWKKMRVEELIFQSGLDYVILQPCAYIQNIQGYWSAIMSEGEYAVPYAVSTQISVVDLEDVAQAAARILTEPGHAAATYELAGPEALSPLNMAETISGITGKTVVARELDRSVWSERVRSSGMPDYEVSTLLKMFEYYEKNHFRGNSRALEGLLGRKPRRFSETVSHLVAGVSSNG